MTPAEIYQQALKDKTISPDEAQNKAVTCLQDLYDLLVERFGERNSLSGKLKQSLFKKGEPPVPGYYFWGGVGRGKTFLMDLFFEALPFDAKQRMHFHRFMQMVHHKLRELKEKEDPLDIVADDLAERTLVLCFDEFHVADITDAMILGGLLEALFERGVTLVATSNEHPDELYQDGLQRQRFLPAIELIKQHTRVESIDSGIDYRLRFLDEAEIYHSPLDERAGTMLVKNFAHMALEAREEKNILRIEGRDIKAVRIAGGVMWIEFRELCDGPRGAADYLEIALCFHTVLVANIPVMKDAQADMAKRFMTLVDVFYDHNVKLIITAAAPPEGLYIGRKIRKFFDRTISRLTEMATHDYLARQHLP
ncbi:MAG: AFG1 family ATPase [Thiotrichales bacterium]|nr:AFG1 family ATPase [Thiotrichales bacterium]